MNFICLNTSSVAESWIPLINVFFTYFLTQSTDVTIMAQGGILAQLGMTQNIVSTATESQTRAPVMHIADGHAETRNTILSESSLLPHADLQGILSSSLTPQLNSMSIASAASEQERCQLWQTTANLSHILLEARTRQEKGIDTATVVQGITCNCTDQSKRGYVEYAEVQCAGKRGSVSNATDAHQEDSGSDFEVNLKVSAVLRLYLIYCASLLRIILCVISARMLKNGGFCFKSGARQRGKSSFSIKRVW